MLPQTLFLISYLKGNDMNYNLLVNLEIWWEIIVIDLDEKETRKVQIFFYSMVFNFCVEFIIISPVTFQVIMAVSSYPCIVKRRRRHRLERSSATETECYIGELMISDIFIHNYFIMYLKETFLTCLTEYLF